LILCKVCGTMVLDKLPLMEGSYMNKPNLMETQEEHEERLNKKEDELIELVRRHWVLIICVLAVLSFILDKN